MINFFFQTAIVLSLVTAGGVFSSKNALAATVTFTVVPNIVLGDSATIVEVRIDPAGKKINAVEGILRLQKADDVVISSVVTETGGSALSLWPLVPDYSSEEGIIRFTGGAPRGFSEEELLFRMRIFIAQPGQIALSWISGAAYLDDGFGTVEPITSRSITVSAAQSLPNPINPASVDSEPPYFDMVEVANDPGLFEGKSFISFHASDDKSGIDRYEVTENQSLTESKEGIYVFLDQERKESVLLTAFDKAGNSVSVKVPAKHERTMYFIGTFVFLLMSVLFFLRKKSFSLSGNPKKK